MSQTYSVTIVTNDAGSGKDVEIKVPVTCRIRLVRNARALKAIAAIDYMGITINDIRITETRGDISITFPEREYQNRKNGETRYSSVVFPNSRGLAKELNHIILQEYSKRMLERGDEPALSVLSNNRTEQESVKIDAA